MSIFKKKDKNAIPKNISGKSVEYSPKVKKEEKQAEKKKEVKKEKSRRFKKSFRNLLAEAKKVSWPTWKKTLFSTWVVILVVFIFTVIILAIDSIFTVIFTGITRQTITGKDFQAYIDLFNQLSQLL